MSNFLPKDYDAATREFYSSVAKRTRSKRKIYFGVAHGNSCSSGDVEEINTDHGLDETFAPTACRKGKKTAGQSQGNRNEDVNSKEIEIEKIDKAEFRNKRLHSASKKGSSIRQQLRGDSAANFTNPSGVSKNVPFLDIHECSFSRDAGDTSSDEENFEMKNSVGKDETSGTNGLKKGKKVVGQSWGNSLVGASISRDRGRPMKRGRRQSSFMSKDGCKKMSFGNKIGEISSEEIEIERIDEAEFRRKEPPSSSMRGSFAGQGFSEGDSAADCRENARDCENQSEPKEIDEHRNERVGFVERITGSGSGSGNKRTISLYYKAVASSQEDLIDSNGRGHQVSQAIASQTQLKRGILKKQSKVDRIILDSSDELLSPSDSGFDSVDDEDFSMENSDSSDTVYSSCSSKEHYVVDKKSEDHINKKGTVAQHTSKRRDLSGCNNEKEINPRSCKRQVLHEKTSRIYGVGVENERTANMNDDANGEDGLKERASCKRQDTSMQACTHEDFERAERINSIHSKGQSWAGTEREDNASSSTYLPDENEVQEKCDITCVGLQGHTPNEELHVDDEMSDKEEGTKQPTKKIPVTSGKHYNFIRILSDSVLNKGADFDREESDEEAKQEPAPQNTLPLKFRFEDEVPKPVEQSEFEKMVESLFSEADFAQALEEMGSFDYQENDKKIANAHDAKETQQDRCSRGEHAWVLQDEIGLRCKYCPHVEYGPEEVMPPWVEKTYREPDRKISSDTEQLYMFDGLDLASSVVKFTGISSKAQGTVWNIKSGLREGLYKHQQEGFEFLWKNIAGSIDLTELRASDPTGVGGCIISHAPGTGKTRLAIVFLETYLNLFPMCRPMIIAPASMLLTWEEEFRKWEVKFPFHNLGSLEFSGKENKLALKHLSKRKCHDKDAVRWVKVYSWHKGASVLGISYTLYEKLAGEKPLVGEELVKGKGRKKRKRIIVDEETDPLKKILIGKPGLVILDEGHTPRNDRSSIWNTLLKLKTEKCVILSGTPFQNNFAELFNTLRLVRPEIADIVGKESQFAEMITSREKKMRKLSKGPRSSSIADPFDNASIEKLKSAIAPFVHVHKGTILQQSIPGLRDCVILLKPPTLQKSLIERIEGSPSTFEFEHKVALISVHPYLFLHSHSTETEKLEFDQDALEASRLNPNEGVKTRFVMELVRLSIANNEKVLIFSQYIQPLEIIKEQLIAIFNWVDGKQIFTMQGKLDQKQRQTWINLFNDPQSEVKVMLASTKCCSEVLLDVVWNPSVERQAISRAYRLGQKKVVYTYHLMTSGTTEGDKYCRQAEKDRLSELVFSSSSNENEDQKKPAVGIEDKILEEMVDHAKLKDMFVKIVNQPKDTNLIETFGSNIGSGETFYFKVRWDAGSVMDLERFANANWEGWQVDWWCQRLTNNTIIEFRGATNSKLSELDLILIEKNRSDTK
ncbi:SNF2 domain-containing protein CLASSY 4-like [Forsythia ovata]|uniref:SNF2 domain-containing protein CLASSY 4-like n=1 Tax=Forsythia ovata TaxID=205694 RepID=A0ABD1QRY8_9LAMI